MHIHYHVHPRHLARLPWGYHVMRIMCIMCLAATDDTTPPLREGCGQRVWA